MAASCKDNEGPSLSDIVCSDRECIRNFPVFVQNGDRFEIVYVCACSLNEAERKVVKTGWFQNSIRNLIGV